MSQRLTVTTDLAREEVFALVQFLKRAGFNTYRDCAVDEDEARLMLAAAGHLRKGLTTAAIKIINDSLSTGRPPFA